VDYIRKAMGWSQLVVLAAFFLISGAAVSQTKAAVTGTFSGLVYDRATQTYNSVLTLTNNGQTLYSPLTLEISTGNSGVSVAGAKSGSGNTFSATVPLPNGSLLSGLPQSVTIAFSDPTRVSFIPTIKSVAGGSPNLPFSDATLYSNVGSPQILSYAQGGNNFTFFGERSTQGTPQSVTGLQTTTAAGGNSYTTLDATGRPLSVHLSDGSNLTFAWTSATQATVTAVTADGAHQVSVGIDTTGPNTTATQSPAIGNTIGFAHAQNSTNTASHFFASLPKATASDTENGEIDVTVQANSQPVSGAFVLATVVPRSLPDTPGYTLELGEIAPGKYAAGFANFPSAIPTETVQADCTTTVDIVATACEAGVPISTYMVAQGCLTIAASFAALPTPPTAATAALFLAGCEAAFKLIGTACEVGKDIPAEGFCENLAAILDLFDPDGETITATATNDGETGSASGEFSGSTPVASLSIDLMQTGPLIYTDPAPGWPYSGPTPTVPGQYTATGNQYGCTDPSFDSSSTQSGATTENIIPPYFFLRSFYLSSEDNAYWSGANITMVPQTVTFQEPAAVDNAPPNAGTDTYTYSISESGTVVSETLTLLTQINTDLSGFYTHVVSTDTTNYKSTYDTKSGGQTFSVSEVRDDLETGGVDTVAGCSYAVHYTESGSGSFNWLSSSNAGTATKRP
jgi:hypothetical protein